MIVRHSKVVSVLTFAKDSPNIRQTDRKLRKKLAGIRKKFGSIHNHLKGLTFSVILLGNRIISGEYAANINVLHSQDIRHSVRIIFATPHERPRMLTQPGVHTNDFAPIHRLCALKLGHASLATVFRPGRLTLQPILRENLESPVLRYQPITTAVVTDACLNTRWHHGAYTSAVLRESLGLDRVVTVYVA